MMLGYYVRLAWLNLTRTPLLTALVVLIMGLGIAVPATFETIRSAWSANPMAAKNDRLFAVQLQSQSTTESAGTADDIPLRLIYKDVSELRFNPTPKRQAAMAPAAFSVKAPNKALKPFIERAWAADRDFFAMFEAPFLYGGAWHEATDREAEPVAVISESLSRRLFGAGNQVGAHLAFNQIEFTIVGIIRDWAPVPRFYDLESELTGEIHIFVPFSTLERYELQAGGFVRGRSVETVTYRDFLNSEARWLQYWVELENADQKAQYEAFLQSHIERQKQLGRFPRPQAQFALRTPQQWLAYRQVVDERINVLSLLGYLFLFVCMINASVILAGKFLRYTPILGVRRALGAKGLDLYVQLMVEVGVLGSLAAALALVMTALGLWRAASLSQRIANLAHVSPNMFAITLAIALISLLVIGLYPAYRACNAMPAKALKKL